MAEPELRDWQEKALKIFEEHYYVENKDRGNMLIACGAGETRFISECLSIIKNNTKKDFIVIVICTSRLTIMNALIEKVKLNKNCKFYTNTSKTDLEKNSVSKLKGNEHNDFQYHLDPIENEFLKDGLNIIFTTYESSSEFCEYAEQSDYNIDFMIFDESHHTTEINKENVENVKKIWQSEYSELVKKYMFLTATQKIYNTFGDDSYCENDCEIMIVNTQHVMKYGYQNKCMYGERIFELSFYDAIYKEKILCEYETYNIEFSYTGDDLTNFKLNVKQQEPIYYKKIINTIHDTIMNEKFHDKKRLIVYSQNINECNNFEQLFDEMQFENMQCEILHSKKTDKENKQTLKDFLDETKQKQIIISVDMISEGLDVPNCDSILFLYNESSAISIMQCIGRSLREYEGEKNAMIYVPSNPEIINIENELINNAKDKKYILEFCEEMKTPEFESIVNESATNYVDIQKEENPKEINITNDTIGLEDIQETEITASIQEYGNCKIYDSSYYKREYIDVIDIFQLEEKYNAYNDEQKEVVYVHYNYSDFICYSEYFSNDKTMTHDNAKKVINNITENYGIILHSIILYHQFYKYIFNRFLLNEKLANEKLTYVENNTSFVDQEKKQFNNYETLTENEYEKFEQSLTRLTNDDICVIVEQLQCIPIKPENVYIDHIEQKTDLLRFLSIIKEKENVNEHTSNVLSKVFYNLDEKPIYFYNYNGNNGYCKLTSSTHEIKLTDEIINYFNAVTLFVRNTLEDNYKFQLCCIIESEVNLYFDTSNEKKLGEPEIPKNRTEQNYNVVIIDNFVYQIDKKICEIETLAITNFDMNNIIKAIE